jgi:hypothetical protein
VCFDCCRRSLFSRNSMAIAMHLAWLICCLLFTTQPVFGQTSPRLQSYLHKLGLIDLQLRSGEQQLAEATENREQLAQDLANKYAQRLLEVSDNTEAAIDLQESVESLMKRFPAVDSPALQVMLLQAEYRRIEKRFLEWLEDGSKTSSREIAVEKLGKLLPRLKTVREALQTNVNEKWKNFESAEEQNADLTPYRREVLKSLPTVSKLEQELNLERTSLARAQFFSGWSELFLGLATANPAERETAMKQAILHFSTMLELPPDVKTYEFDSTDSSLQLIWRARAVMGLGIAHTSLKQTALAHECYDILVTTAPPNVREAAPYWFTLSLLQSQQYTAAIQWCNSDRVINENSGGTATAILLVRYGWQLQTPELSLVRNGMHILARQNKQEIMGALLTKYRPEPTTQDGFHALWIHGQQLLAAAEKSETATDLLAQAETVLQQALNLKFPPPTAAEDPLSQTHCQFTLGWCYYKREKWGAAARLFQQCARAYESLQHANGVQAAWMVYYAEQALYAQSHDARDAQAAREALLELQRVYPQSEQAKRAELLLTKLALGSQSSADYSKSLAAVKPDSPNYFMARYELCMTVYRQWQAAKESPEKLAEQAVELRKLADHYLSASTSAEGLRRGKVALAVVDTLLSNSQPDWTICQKYLQEAASACHDLKNQDPILWEVRYRQLQKAQAEQDSTQIQHLAQWLTDNAPGSSYELPALVLVARHVEAKYESATTDRAEQLQNVLKIYTKLVQLLGDTPEILQSKKNAVIATSKLAQFEYDSANFSSAATRLEKLANLFPDDANYTRRAGLAFIALKEHEQALHYWQKLVLGTKQQTELWYEAKYHQLLCMQQTEPAAAQKSWKQFKLLHPTIPFPQWQAKFQELETTLK